MANVLISFLAALVGLLLLLNTRLGKLALDRPNHRSLHNGVIPRTGGLAIMAAVLLSWGLISSQWIWAGLLCALVVICLMDDVYELPVKWRLLGQVVISILFVWLLGTALAWWWQVTLVLVLVWMANLYNFMDGSDGLAGGMAVFGFGAYAMAAYLAEAPQFAGMSACIVSASLAFLIFNFHPARIFMGDGGSVPLGFVAGSMGIYGWQHGLWPVWFPVLVFSPFIADSTVTLLKRLFRGEKVWEAHRSHYYQHLVQMGWGHRKTAFAEYGLMLAVSVTAVLLLAQPMPVVLGVLVLWTLAYMVLMRLIDRRWSLSESS